MAVFHFGRLVQQIREIHLLSFARITTTFLGGLLLTFVQKNSNGNEWVTKNLYF